MVSSLPVNSMDPCPYLHIIAWASYRDTMVTIKPRLWENKVAAVKYEEYLPHLEYCAPHVY